MIAMTRGGGSCTPVSRYSSLPLNSTVTIISTFTITITILLPSSSSRRCCSSSNSSRRRRRRRSCSCCSFGNMSRGEPEKKSLQLCLCLTPPHNRLCVVRVTCVLFFITDLCGRDVVRPLAPRYINSSNKQTTAAAGSSPPMTLMVFWPLLALRRWHCFFRLCAQLSWCELYVMKDVLTHTHTQTLHVCVWITLTLTPPHNRSLRP